MLAGLSTEAAKMIDPNYAVAPTANMFFMIVSTFLITILGWFVTDKIVEPRLGVYSGKSTLSKEDQDLQNLSDKEMLMIKDKEGKKILSKVKANSYVIALAIDGKNLSSEELADTMSKLAVRGSSHITFIIGGSLVCRMRF